mmetsp:Transcript_47017/g.134545  ORF Transcript_47017/g.134545 Transcript_47017/m.134545 type:complete len:250 (-) Transcript_47017:1829-2578(-)
MAPSNSSTCMRAGCSGNAPKANSMRSRPSRQSALPPLMLDFTNSKSCTAWTACRTSSLTSRTLSPISAAATSSGCASDTAAGTPLLAACELGAMPMVSPCGGWSEAGPPSVNPSAASASVICSTVVFLRKPSSASACPSAGFAVARGTGKAPASICRSRHWKEESSKHLCGHGNSFGCGWSSLSSHKKKPQPPWSLGFVHARKVRPVFGPCFTTTRSTVNSPHLHLQGCEPSTSFLKRMCSNMRKNSAM